MVSVSKAIRALTDGVTAIIPVWNRADLLLRLLDSIAVQTLPPREVLVVDNGSADNAIAVAASRGARVLAMGRNAGFAAAVNRGIGEAKTVWIAVLNSDVELEPDWLAALVEAATETEAWFATGKILSASDRSRLDGTWDLIARSGCPWRAGHGALDSPVFSQRRPIAMTSATAVLYRRELFQRIGNFAEIYESYLEDVDLSLRCAASGLRGVYEPSAVCAHHGGASSGAWDARVTYLISRNQALLVRRLFPIELRRQWRWNLFVGQFLWGLVALRHGRFGPWLRGKRDARPFSDRVVLPADKLKTAVTASEREIRSLQAPRPSLYWRLYFLFTSVESE